MKNGQAALSLGEKVSRSGAFISRSGTGEGSAANGCRKEQNQQQFKRQMAKVKWQMVEDMKNRQIAEHLNFAICHCHLNSPVACVAKKGSNPSPVRRRLMKAPSRDTLSPGLIITHIFGWTPGVSAQYERGVSTLR